MADICYIYYLFYLKPIKDITKRNRVTRGIYGRRERNNSSEGLVTKKSGKQISPSTFIIPLDKSSEVIRFLNKEKLDYSFIELWSDQIY